MHLEERFDEYVPTRGIFANRSIVLDTKKCECTQTKGNPIFYDADKKIEGLSYEGRMFTKLSNRANSLKVTTFNLNNSLHTLVGVQIARGVPLWAPANDFPASTPDIQVHMSNNIWKHLTPIDGAIGDSHFKVHPRILCTKYPEVDDIDYILNQLISSVRTVIEQFNGHHVTSFAYLTVPYRHSIDRHHLLWSLSSNITAWKMKSHPSRYEINPILLESDFEE